LTLPIPGHSSTESWKADAKLDLCFVGHPRIAFWHLRFSLAADFDLCCLKRVCSDNRLMSEHIYKKIELVGSSPRGFEAAVHNALERANKTIRNMRWFEVVDTRGQIEEGRVNHWQVTLKVGFTLDG
jgi:flavin-binding protein dodecin